MTSKEQHPAAGLPLDKIQMLQQPLLTEDGFINEACLNELSAALHNMPETHERLRDDPEWTVPCIVSADELAGSLACYAIIQALGPPPKLAVVVEFLLACLKRDPAFEKYDEFWFATLSLCDLNKKLWEILDDLREFQDWNKESVTGKHWIDLSALLHNVCLHVRDKRRHSYAFDEGFRARHPEFNDEEGG